MKRALGRNYVVKTTQFAEYTDENGMVVIEPNDISQHYNIVAIARNDEGRLAYLGFNGIWYPNYYDYEYNETKVYIITDRPVYRPDQTVKFKAWIRKAQYDQEDKSFFAGQKFTLRLDDPQGNKVLEETFTTDEYGGFDGEYKLPDDAPLGQYYVWIVNYGGSSYFRVEEYKKPEFEVTVEAPSEPVMLGEKVTATVTADYYFGAPVVNAKVKYKVQRSKHSTQWYPFGIWDWFYGPGYWWFAYDYTWYPGWSNWGCWRPIGWWIGWNPDPPELVIENEVEIGANGTVEIEIDTAIAKELHGDSDHEYEITAEVTDESRRTIVGKGHVMVARKPFKVYAWVDRGHYRVGDTIQANFSAQTIDHKPVKGEGKLVLYSLSYDENGKPLEKKAQSWKLDTNAQGKADMQMKASKPGQYRLSYEVTDSQGHTMEGGYLFIVAGEGFESGKYRFNDLELINDKREYAPGEKVKLRINTNRKGSTVYLFTRPANGVYHQPRVLRLEGKSAVEEIEVTKKDMPNFFLEAFTVYNGEVYRVTKEIVVPPEKRILNLDVKPSSDSYKPGEDATLKIRLTDLDGKPFTGSVTLTIYDKAVEYVSGGSNVTDIKSFFWKWRRSHNSQQDTNILRYFYNLLRSNETGMAVLGEFGDMIFDTDEETSIDMLEGAGYGGGGRQRESRSRGPLKMKRMMKSAAPMADGADYFAEESEMVIADSVAMPSAGEAAPEEPEGAEMATPMIRKKFADTAYWVANLLTDDNGEAEIKLTMPENLTGWKIRAWAMSHGTKVGEAETIVVTSKNLLLRLQAPRFFVEKDEVVLSANIHNYLDSEKKVHAVLELEGGTLELKDDATKKLTIDAKGEQRVDWLVKAVKEGEAIIRMKALTDEESDAMEMSFPVKVHGMMKMVPYCGAIRPENETASLTINVPKERRVGESRLEIRYSPTLAMAMVDALPYLVEYPYGCTEQTLNRFLPTVITQKILKEMDVDLKAIQEKRTNLNAQEIGDDKERAKQWQRWDRNPVFDESTVKDMVKQGLKALTNQQLSDGGWGWFSGWGEYSWPHTTAVVVHGLQVAKANGVAVVPRVLERGVNWLKTYQKKQIRMLKNAPSKKDPWKEHAGNLDALVFMVLTDADVKNLDMLEFLYRDRKELAVYAKAMYGMALSQLDEKEKLDMMMRNIEQYLMIDEENQTAWLNLQNGGYWWYWYGSEYEAHAYYLKLLAKTEPKSEKAAWLVKYLLNNRKHATYWNSTRDTALCVEAMADFIRASGEAKPDLSIDILVDGEKMKSVEVDSENLFTFDNKLVIEGAALESGEHKIEFKKKGQGPLYYNTYLSYFSLEDFIEKAGLEIKVERKYYKLIPVEKTVKVAGSRGQALDQRVEKYERELIENLDTLKSGDLVEIELEIESKNDYEYIVFEDMKAAGFEPVEVRSGYTQNGMGAYMELRDDCVSFFVRQLMRGKHSIAYRMRAEIPGKFSALPTKAHAMYAPELKANSDELKIRIAD